MDGFAVGENGVARPAVGVEQSTRDRLVRVLVSIMRGATPEEVTQYLQRGFPEDVDDQLAIPLEAAEMSDHVDVVLAAMQSTVAAAA